MHVDVIYIRHGFSCANAIQRLSKWHQKYKRLFYKDPPLTQFAIDQIRQFRAHIDLKPDIVCSSTLLRAIQTACNLFPRHKISVIPFVKERGIDNQNQPLAPELQQQLLEPNEQKRVDFYWANHSGRHAAHHPSFKQWISQHLPELLQRHRISKDRSHVTIAVVTHSQYMKKFLNDTYSPKNVQAVRYSYDWDGTSLEVTKRAHLLFEGFSIPSKAEFQAALGDSNCKYKIF